MSQYRFNLQIEGADKSELGTIYEHDVLPRTGDKIYLQQLGSLAVVALQHNLIGDDGSWPPYTLLVRYGGT